MSQTGSVGKQDFVDLIIIGAGPAGLSCAYFAKKKGINYIVVESGDVGESWKQMSAHFKLITPMWTNYLPSDIFRINPFSTMSCNRYGEYLKDYASRHRLRVLVNSKITSLRKVNNGYAVTHEDQEFQTKCVIVATGYYSYPNVPEVATYSKATQSGYFPCFHSNNFDENLDYITAAKGEILIVGKGNSAGQLAALLIKAGKRIGFSVRGSIEFRNDDTIVGKFRQFIYFYWELILIARNPYLQHNSFPPMDAAGVRKHYELGQINTYPEIDSINRQSVTFKDGSVGIFSAIIFATGYHPAYKRLNTTMHLKGDALHTNTTESQKESGLFYAGLDNQTNFRSRYLRGIRNDASRIMTSVKNFLAS